MTAPLLGPIGDLGAHALLYAEAGLEVFPADPRSKAPLTPKGFYDATTDLDVVGAWWGRWPEALIAHRIAACHLLLDVDPRHGGIEVWMALKAELGGILPATRVHQSGRGDMGTHFWWLRPAERLSTKHLDAWAKERDLGQALEARWTAGIDLLHHSCRYSILPPSPHPATGAPYRWVEGRGLEVTPAPLPGLLADLVVVDEPEHGDWTPAEPDPESIADWYSATFGFSFLRSHGWAVVAGDGNGEGSRWRHPEATAAHSATVRHGCLFVFSTSTPFEPTTPGEPHGHTPFRAFAVLEHGGDLARAARAARDLKEPGSASDLSWIPGPPPVVAEPLAGGEVGVAGPVRDPDMQELLANSDADYDWLVEGLLERGDRLVLTGPEGGGKSTLLRQIAVQVASGIHPFSEDAIDPVRVLFVDLENSRRQTVREFSSLVFQAGTALERNMLVPLIRPEGLDLLKRPDCVWLAERIEANDPGLVVIGPLYKLALGDPTSEEVARQVAFVLDTLRTGYGVTLLLEAHQPHRMQGSARPDRPYGASLWMRWPEFGLVLTGAGFLHHWRGARDEREWPSVLRRGGAWPWTVATAAQANFAAVMAACREAGEILTERELAKRTGMAKTTVHRSIEANRGEWTKLTGELGGGEEE